jgi:tricorn protease-like protein
MLMDKDKEAVIRGLDWTPDGRYVIAADNKAFLHLISVDRNNSLVEVGKPFRTKTTDIVEKRKFKKGVCFVEEVKISPNGRFIIIGAHAAGSLFEVIGLNGETLSLVREHKTNITSALLHADWSTKEDLYVVNSQGY